MNFKNPPTDPVWGSTMSSERITYNNHCEFLGKPVPDVEGGTDKKAGPLDPRQDTIDALKKIFDNEDIAKAFEAGLMKYVIQHLQPIELNLCWKDSHLLQMYTFLVRDKIKLLRKYPKKVKELEKLDRMEDVELEAQKESFDFIPSAWNSERNKEDVLAKKLSFKKTSDLIRCRACKQKTCTIKLMQTRSADEPADMFITCTNCGKRWKESSA